MARIDRKYRSHLSLREEEMKYEEMQQFRVKCKCGHTNYIANKNGRCICSHCHNWVFKDKKTEFEYRMKEKLLEERRNNK